MEIIFWTNLGGSVVKEKEKQKKKKKNMFGMSKFVW